MFSIHFAVLLNLLGVRARANRSHLASVPLLISARIYPVRVPIKKKDKFAVKILLVRKFMRIETFEKSY